MNIKCKVLFKQFVIKYILFMAPAMFLAAKGFADLWISGQRQPYIALTLLLLAVVTALMLVTLASALLLLSRRHAWIPPGPLILIITGMKLFFDISLGTTVGIAPGLVATSILWFTWASLAYRQYRRAFQRS